MHVLVYVCMYVMCVRVRADMLDVHVYTHLRICVMSESRLERHFWALILPLYTHVHTFTHIQVCHIGARNSINLLYNMHSQHTHKHACMYTNIDAQAQTCRVPLSWAHGKRKQNHHGMRFNQSLKHM
jgi:hypothetical protein